eukprot:6192600-Pleurochrysis_carterae.AAC.1
MHGDKRWTARVMLSSRVLHCSRCYGQPVSIKFALPVVPLYAISSRAAASPTPRMFTASLAQHALCSRTRKQPRMRTPTPALRPRASHAHS